jgi:hypothetical protein
MVKILKIKKTSQAQPVAETALAIASPPEPIATAAAKKVIKLKKAIPVQVPQEPVPVAVAAPAPVAVVVAAPVPVAVPTVQKKILKLKKAIKTPCPPPPPAGSYLSPAAEAFEAVRLYCEGLGIEVPEEEIKHYYAELEKEKNEYTEFWSQHGCSVTMAILLAAANGEDMEIAQAKAKLVEKKKVITEDSIGEMPAYGTPEFWAWCRRRKELRLQKEAAIIAAGGTVPPQKVKVQKVQKVQKKEAAP